MTSGYVSSHSTIHATRYRVALASGNRPLKIETVGRGRRSLVSYPRAGYWVKPKLYSEMDQRRASKSLLVEQPREGASAQVTLRARYVLIHKWQVPMPRICVPRNRACLVRFR
jgi:hypothetical protein